MELVLKSGHIISSSILSFRVHVKLFYRIVYRIILINLHAVASRRISSDAILFKLYIVCVVTMLGLFLDTVIAFYLFDVT